MEVIKKKFCLMAVFIATILNAEGSNRDCLRKFPEHVMLGAATAAFQVEGAWDEDGRTAAIWDYLTHTRRCIAKDCRNADIAADSYHNVERDVEMMRELGLDFYRFSLSWSRILPTGFPNYINEAAVAYYNKLIDEMLKYNIKPVVTVNHFDIPQKLQEMGGWLNPNVMDWFGDFAKIAFQLFGDRVKHWVTINEPHQMCISYEDGTLSEIHGHALYLCSKNVLLAHARAYHIYDEEFRASQNGVAGIAVHMTWYEPDTDSEEDLQAREDIINFDWRLYANPIFSESGDFPASVKEKVAAKSAAQGFLRSRLPELSPEEISYIKGTSDFLGVNHYTTRLIYRNASVYGVSKIPSINDDQELGFYQKSEWPAAASIWLKTVPWGLYKSLTRLREEFDNPPIFITENGFSTIGGLQDVARVDYLRGYLEALLDAIDDGSNVMGYTAWSLMDNFEWSAGFTDRFGLYEVDFERCERPRKPRLSAFIYKEILRTRIVDRTYQPDNIEVIAIDPGN